MSGADILSKNLDRPEVYDTLSGRADAGVDIEFIIHRNTPESVRTLLKEGKARVYYSPVPTKVGGNIAPESDNMILVDRRHYLQILQNKLWSVRNSFWGANSLNADFGKLRANSYTIPVEQIDAVYAMIRQGYEPEVLISYLETGAMPESFSIK